MQVEILTKEDHFEVIEQMITDNLIKNVAQSKQESEGFLIANYTREVLKKFNAVCPILLAIQEDEVRGYMIGHKKFKRDSSSN